MALKIGYLLCISHEVRLQPYLSDSALFSRLGISNAKTFFLLQYVLESNFATKRAKLVLCARSIPSEHERDKKSAACSPRLLGPNLSTDLILSQFAK